MPLGSLFGSGTPQPRSLLENCCEYEYEYEDERKRHPSIYLLDKESRSSCIVIVIVGRWSGAVLGETPSTSCAMLVLCFIFWTKAKCE